MAGTLFIQEIVLPGSGWILRELSKPEPQKVRGFIVTHLPLFTREGLGYAMEKFPAKTRSQIEKLHSKLNEEIIKKRRTT